MLTPTPCTMLRSSIARPSTIQPLFVRSVACPSSTTVVSPFFNSCRLLTQGPPSNTPSRPSRTLQPKTGPCHHSLILRRAASTDAKADASAASAAASARVGAHPEQPPLDWNTFFQLRKSRRRWQVAFSVASLLSSGTAGALFVSTGAAEPVVNQIPLDPLVTLGLITFSFAALGWLIGPSMGSAVFYALNRKWKAQMTLKEGQFFARIKKNRVDPSASSAGNPGKSSSDAFYPPKAPSDRRFGL